MSSSHGQVKPKRLTLVFAFFFAKHAALRSKSNDWLAWNLDNVSE
jgi:hypothetical protein